MIPTNKMAHFENGSNSVLGLPVFQSGDGTEVVLFKGRWVRLSGMPLRKTRDHIRPVTGRKNEPVETFVSKPKSPDNPAFNPTTDKQRVPDPKPLNVFGR